MSKKSFNDDFGLSSTITCCKNCTDRYEACHDYCKEYKSQKAIHESMKKNRKDKVESELITRKFFKSF